MRLTQYSATALKISCALVLGLASNSLTWAQARGRFFTPTEVVEPRTPITYSGNYSVGFSVDAVFLSSSPYKQVVGSTESDFRFQVPTSGSLEVSRGISNKLEVGVSVGSLGYESRFQTGSGAGQRIDTAHFKSFPDFKALARYFFPIEQGIATEFEGALGFGFGKLTIVSTDLGATPIDESMTTFGGHAAFGLALGWAEGYTAHLLAGYSFTTLNSKTYSIGVGDIKQAGSLGGAYFKAQLRYHF